MSSQLGKIFGNGQVWRFSPDGSFMLSVFVYAYTSEKFNLRPVTFYGCKEINPKRMESVIRQNFPANILRIDLGELKDRLEKETWVKAGGDTARASVGSHHLCSGAHPVGDL